jgi:hypothetical protein
MNGEELNPHAGVRIYQGRAFLGSPLFVYAYQYEAIYRAE